MKGEKDFEIDQCRLIRQLAVFGHEAQKKFMSMRIFCHGVTGLGVQVTKNLIMMGPKSVTLYDPHIVTMADVGRNIFCSQIHIGKVTRAQACLKKLQELNSKCMVETTEDSSIEFITKNFDFVVMIDNFGKNYIISVNQKCRENKIGFITAGCLGLYGYVFVDFGQNHTIEDLSEKEPQNIYIFNIKQGQRTVVQCLQFQRHGLQTGDIVEFKSAKGMTQINGMKFQVKVIDRSSFQIGDTRNFSPYVAEGIVKKVIFPIKKSFKSFQESLECYKPSRSEVSIICDDCSQKNQRIFLHLTLKEIYNFYEKYGRLPKLLMDDESQELYQNVHSKIEITFQNVNQSFQKIDFQIVKSIGQYAETQISPICSFFGGIVAQQVVKFIGKFTPINPWIHYQFFDLLPKKHDEQITRNFMSSTNRYNDYVALFGDQFLSNIKNFKIFQVGSGSLGCQHIKILSMMGASSGEHGKLIIADDKKVYSHNLTSHFLLKEENIGKLKVQSVIKNAQQINSGIKFKYLPYELSEKRQEVFNDDLWNETDFIISAVDNNRSANYIDENCVWYEKPLFHTSIQGLKGNSQIVLPHITSTITDVREIQDNHIDRSTLINFPFKTQHLIEWASSYRYTILFTYLFDYLSQFYAQPKKLIDSQGIYDFSQFNQFLEIVKKLHQAKTQKSYQICVQLMIKEFLNEFVDRIKKITTQFQTYDHQTKFWTGLKRKPEPLAFDLTDPLTLQFIQAGANIYAAMLNIPIEKNVKSVQKISEKVYNEIQKFVKPLKKQFDQSTFAKLVQELNEIVVNGQDMPKAVNLDLQDEANWQLQYIYSAANLRAKNYRIEPAEMFQIKVHVGKILPKVITTAAITAGLAGVQIIKYLLKKNVDDHKNTYSNLALPQFVFSKPCLPIIKRNRQYDPVTLGPIVVIPGQFTKWDKIDIKKSMLICDLIQHFKKEYNIKIIGVVYGKDIVYCNWLKLKTLPRLIMSVEDAISQAVKQNVGKRKTALKLEVLAQLFDGTDCILPDIRYFISRKKY